VDDSTSIEAPARRSGTFTRRQLLMGAGALAMGPLLEACSGGSGGTTNAKTGTSATTSGGKPDRTAILQFAEMQGESYDPIHMVAVEYPQLNAIFDTLLSYNYLNGNLEPRLATSWQVANERIRLTLRQGVTFQDGTPFNAQAVKYSIDRVLHDPASNIKTPIYMLGGVNVVDSHTVDLMLNTNAPDPLLYQLADRPGMIVSQAAVEKAGGSDGFSLKPVGAGMYAIDGQWFPREKMSVRAWPGYWDKTAQSLGGIDFTNVLEAAVVNSLRAGAEDFGAGLLGVDAPAVRADSSLHLKSGPGTSYVYGLNINITMPPLNNVKVRQAISYALDRNTFNQALAGGLGAPVYQFAVPSSPAYDPSLNSIFQYNPTKAKQLLKEAGFPNGVSFGSVIGATAANYVQFAELIQSQLKQVGINMQLQLINQSLTVPDIWRAGPTHHGIVASAALVGGFGAVGLDTTGRNYLLPDGSTNAGGVEVPGVRALLDQAVASDAATAAKLYKQVNRIVTEGVYAMVPIYDGPNIMAYHDYVGGPLNVLSDAHPDFFRGVFINQGKAPIS
jgi:ABC-type transport system substrate-binding protein